MAHLETKVPDFAVRRLMCLAGVEAEGARRIMEADLAESYRSSAFVNTDWGEVRRMYDSGNPIWYGTYTITLEDVASEAEAVCRVLAENDIHTISRAIVVMTGSKDRLGLTGIKAICAALRDRLGLVRWTFGVVQHAGRSDRVRLTLLLEAPQS